MTTVPTASFSGMDRSTSFAEQVRRFLLAACGELERIGGAQLATGRGDAVVRRYVENEEAGS
ncbi:hypothetical protein [Nocardia africana]